MSVRRWGLLERGAAQAQGCAAAQPCAIREHENIGTARRLVFAETIEV